MKKKMKTPVQQMIAAINSNDYEKMKSLFLQGFDCNIKDPNALNEFKDAIQNKLQQIECEITKPEQPQVLTGIMIPIESPELLSKQFEEFFEAKEKLDYIFKEHEAKVNNLSEELTLQELAREIDLLDNELEEKTNSLILEIKKDNNN